MHKIALQIFNFIKDLLTLLNVLTIFCLMLFILYWIEQIISGNWSWLTFFRPFFDNLVIFSGHISSAKFDFFSSSIEIKYFIACIIFALFSGLFHLLTKFNSFCEKCYNDTRQLCKELEENRLNKQLKKNIEKEESKISKYAIAIKTKIKKKFANINLNINLDEQNKILIEFLNKKFKQEAQIFEDGYIYYFDHFYNVDQVLDVLCRVINSSAPIDYAICLQIDNNLNNLKTLLKQNHYNKICITADTKYRYSFNADQKYEISQIGLFQTGDKTIEVHEFKAIS